MSSRLATATSLAERAEATYTQRQGLVERMSAAHERGETLSIDLNDLSSDDVLLFVPNFAAAKSLAEVVEWPITLWPGFKETNSV